MPAPILLREAPGKTPEPPTDHTSGRDVDRAPPDAAETFQSPFNDAAAQVFLPVAWTSFSARTAVGKSVEDQEPRDAADREPDASSRSDLLSRIVRSLSDQPPAVLRAVADAAATIRQPPGLDESLWGPVPDDTAYIRAVMESADRVDRLHRELLKDALTVGQAAERLATTSTDVEERIAAGTLLALAEGQTLLLPLWQFSSQATAALPGIDRVRSEFPGDAVALSSWMVRPNDALGGATPRNALENGEIDAVVAAARALSA